MLASEERNKGSFTSPPLMVVGLGCSAEQSGQSEGLYQAVVPHSSIGVSPGVQFLILNTGLLKHSPRLTEEQAGGGGLVSFGPGGCKQVFLFGPQPPQWPEQCM